MKTIRHFLFLSVLFLTSSAVNANSLAKAPCSFNTDDLASKKIKITLCPYLGFDEKIVEVVKERLQCR